MRSSFSGTVLSVNVSETKGVRKVSVDRAELTCAHGVAGDAHAGDWHRQVSLLAKESIDTMVEKGLDVGPGDFAENITVEGVPLAALPVGTLLGIGDEVELEVSQIGKECHDRCAIYYQAGDCVMPREGIFAEVRKAGVVRPGDPVGIVSRGEARPDGEKG
jgi:MOSC domain-containing protein YiiM